MGSQTTGPKGLERMTREHNKEFNRPLSHKFFFRIIPFGEFRRTSFETLLEKISGSLNLLSAVAFQELGEVGVPDVEHVGPLEHRDALLVGLERFLEVVVLLEEEAVVDDDLRRRDFQLQDSVVHGLGRLEGTEALFQVGVEGPNFQRLVQP